MLRKMINPDDEVAYEKPVTLIPVTPYTLSNSGIPESVTLSPNVGQALEHFASTSTTRIAVVNKTGEEDKLVALKVSGVTVAPGSRSAINREGKTGLSLQMSEKTWFQQNGRIGMVSKSAVTWANPGSLEWVPHSPNSDAHRPKAPSGDQDEPHDMTSAGRVVRPMTKGQVTHVQEPTMARSQRQVDLRQRMLWSDSRVEKREHLVMHPNHARQDHLVPRTYCKSARRARQEHPSPCIPCESTCRLAQIIVGKSVEVGNLVKQLETKPTSAETLPSRCNPHPSLVRQVAQEVKSLRCRVGQLDERMSGCHWHYDATIPSPRHGMSDEERRRVTITMDNDLDRPKYDPSLLGDSITDGFSDHSDSEAPYEQGSGRQPLIQRPDLMPIPPATSCLELPVPEEGKKLPQGLLRPHSGWPQKCLSKSNQAHEQSEKAQNRSSGVTFHLTWV